MRPERTSDDAHVVTPLGKDGLGGRIAQIGTLILGHRRCLRLGKTIAVAVTATLRDGPSVY